MIVCPNCGSQLEDGSIFCTNCGAGLANTAKTAPEPVSQATMNQAPMSQAPGKICPNCGTIVNPDDYVCYNCGAALVNEVAPKKVKQPKQPKADRPSSGKKLPIKKIAIFGGAAVVVIVAVILCINLFSGGKGKDFALYLKDSEVTFNELKKKGGTEITTSYQSNKSNSSYFFMSKDGTLFYPDRTYGNPGESYQLYYRNVYSTKDEPKKVDSGVGSYEVNDSTTLVTYTRNGDLYQCTLKSEEKVKIAPDVSTYYVSKDGKKVYLRTTDNTLYFWESGKEREKIAPEISSITHVNKDFGKVYFMKEGNLYVWEIGKEKEKLLTDVSNVYVYDSGKIYFTEKEELQISADDREKYPRNEMYGGYDEEDNYVYTVTLYNLYYYDGKNKEKIGSNVGTSFLRASENPVIAFAEIEGEELNYSVAAENKKVSITSDTINEYQISKDGSVIYYLVKDKDSESKTGELYKVSVSGTTVGKAEKYDNEVYSLYSFVDKDTVIYSKEYNEKNGAVDIYMNKKKVASEIFGIRYDSDSKKLYYSTDVSSEDRYKSTMKMYYKEKETKISDDVYDVALTVNGNVLYIKDYSSKNSKGDLWYFNGSSSEKMDEDISKIITPRMIED